MGSSDVSDPLGRLFRHVPLRTYQGSVPGMHRRVARGPPNRNAELAFVHLKKSRLYERT